MPTWNIEKSIWNKQTCWLAGTDEVGRGPLAGPVVAAAVMAQEPFDLEGVDDSKSISATKREELFVQIYEKAPFVSYSIVSESEIDRVNILRASLFAMKESLEQLPFLPQQILVDGIHKAPINIMQKTIKKGDQKSFLIAAASIVAKVVRDRIMDDYHNKYPEYDFISNKGYGTPSHLRALEKYGPTPIHRRSFAPISNLEQMSLSLSSNV